MLVSGDRHLRGAGYAFATAVRGLCLLGQSGIPANVPEDQRQLLLESGMVEALNGGKVS